MRKTERGRPVGKPFPVVKQVRLGERDAAQLRALAGRWRVSEAAAMRKLIGDRAEQEKVE